MQPEMLWIPNGNFKPLRYRPGGVGNWSGHLPFASDLIANMRPQLLVELGTHWGESYFGFCQAVAENNVACVCYAVDTWTGEMHSGFYDESVYSDVSAHNGAHYSAFSYLLRTKFDDALANFSDETIDILHIDGLHTHEAVSHDFYAWLPKVKAGGIVLIHDIVGRHDSFGVWKLWDELAAIGDRFTFVHSWGLGVFRKSGGPAAGGVLAALFQSSSEQQEHIRQFYSLCGSKLDCDYTGHHSQTSKIRAQVYLFGVGGHSADRCYNVDFDPGLWQRLGLELPSGVGTGPLRIDLAAQPALIDIAAIRIRKAIDQEILWAAAGPEEIEALEVQGTMKRFEDSDESEFARFISFGSDPQLLLPTMDESRFDQPLVLEIWVRVGTEFSSLLPLLETSNRLRQETNRSIQEDKEALSQERHELLRERDALIRDRDASVQERNALMQDRDARAQERDARAQERDALIQERDGIRIERDSLAAANRKLQGELYVCKIDLERANEDMYRLRADLSETQQKLDASEETYRISEVEVKQQLRMLREDLASAEGNRQSVQNTLDAVLTSRSWRMTAPFRSLMLRLRGLDR